MLHSQKKRGNGMGRGKKDAIKGRYTRKGRWYGQIVSNYENGKTSMKRKKVPKCGGFR